MKTYVMLAAGLLCASPGLQGQMEKAQMEKTVASFQAFTTEGGANIKFLSVQEMNAPAVTGKPLSATEERHTLQVLGDGTRIERTETDRFFRDIQGRTRLERADGTVVIHDPLLGITTESNTSGKNAKVVSVNRTQEAMTQLKQFAKEQHDAAAAKDAFKKQLAEEIATAARKTGKMTTSETEEDLGSSSVSGLIAQGTRHTTLIEAGQIGNDRPIRIVAERWYSNELQMLVKSSNSDPRFGETTYQLTNVSMATPDASLFQVPAERRVGAQ